MTRLVCAVIALVSCVVGLIPALWGYAAAALSVTVLLYRLLLRRPRPSPRDLEFVGKRAIWYPEGAPAKAAFKFLRHVFAALAPPSAPHSHRHLGAGVLAVRGGLSKLSTVTLLPMITSPLALGVCPSWCERATEVVLLLVSTGHSEVELLASEGA